MALSLSMLCSITLPPGRLLWTPLLYTRPKRCQYARYRWDYAPQAIQAILDVTQLSRASVVADVGAGTGILSKHLAGHAGRLYAVEPNPEMRRVAQSELRTVPLGRGGGRSRRGHDPARPLGRPDRGGPGDPLVRSRADAARVLAHPETGGLAGPAAQLWNGRGVGPGDAGAARPGEWRRATTGGAAAGGQAAGLLLRRRTSSSRGPIPLPCRNPGRPLSAR